MEKSARGAALCDGLGLRGSGTNTDRQLAIADLAHGKGGTRCGAGRSHGRGLRVHRPVGRTNAGDIAQVGSGQIGTTKALQHLRLGNDLAVAVREGEADGGTGGTHAQAIRAARRADGCGRRSFDIDRVGHAVAVVRVRPGIGPGRLGLALRLTLYLALRLALNIRVVGLVSEGEGGARQNSQRRDSGKGGEFDHRFLHAPPGWRCEGSGEPVWRNLMEETSIVNTKVEEISMLDQKPARGH